MNQDYMIRFEVPGPPVAKGRPRFSRVGTFTPAKTVQFEERVALFAQAAGVELLEGPVELEVWAYWPCPISRRRKQNPRPEEPRTSAPDGDNVLKAVTDALNGIAYQDDRQVSDAHVHKRTAAQGCAAKTVVIIKEAS